jgi:hypothetical protein
MPLRPTSTSISGAFVGGSITDPTHAPPSAPGPISLGRMRDAMHIELAAGAEAHIPYEGDKRGWDEPEEMDHGSDLCAVERILFVVTDTKGQHGRLPPSGRA